MTNPNEPAMPVEARTPFYHNGLTKREYMATKIMAGMVSNSENIDTDLERIALMAVLAAGELINALNKEGGQ